MKKIIIVAAIAVSAVVAQAASFNWSSAGGASNGKVWDYTGNNALYQAGSTYTAYLFCTSDITQSQLLANVRSGVDLTSANNKAISGAANTLNSSSKIASLSEAFSYAGTVGNDYDFFFAILDSTNEKLLISNIVTGNAQESGTTALSFNANTFSKTAFAGADTAFTNAGWYAVPEPTSGLMLLLGVGLMALRRRHA